MVDVVSVSFRLSFTFFRLRFGNEKGKLIEMGVLKVWSEILRSVPLSGLSSKLSARFFIFPRPFSYRFVDYPFQEPLFSYSHCLPAFCVLHV